MNLKLKKLVILKKQEQSLEKATSALRKGVISKTLASDENHDNWNTAKVLNFVKHQKKKRLNRSF